MIFIKMAEVCNHCNHLILKGFHHAQKIPTAHLQSLLLPPVTFGHHHNTFCLYVFAFSRDFIEIGTHHTL